MAGSERSLVIPERKNGRCRIIPPFAKGFCAFDAARSMPWKTRRSFTTRKRGLLEEGLPLLLRELRRAARR